MLSQKTTPESAFHALLPHGECGGSIARGGGSPALHKHSAEGWGYPLNTAGQSPKTPSIMQRTYANAKGLILFRARGCCKSHEIWK